MPYKISNETRRVSAGREEDYEILKDKKTSPKSLRIKYKYNDDKVNVIIEQTNLNMEVDLGRDMLLTPPKSPLANVDG